MSGINWKAKQSGNPMMLFAAFLGFMGCFYGTYKVFYKPWAMRRRMQEAEGYANFLYEKERKEELEN